MIINPGQAAYWLNQSVFSFMVAFYALEPDHSYQLQGYKLYKLLDKALKDAAAQLRAGMKISIIPKYPIQGE